MRILYVCHRFPYPPRRGGTIRPFNMIKHLSRSHDLVVCSLTRSPQQTRDAEAEKKHFAPMEGMYFNAVMSTLAAVRRMVAERASEA